MRDWLAEPTDEPTEIRDLAVLKLFFGSQAEPEQLRELAERAAAAHRKRLAEYEAIATIAGIDTHERSTLELGLRYGRSNDQLLGKGGTLTYAGSPSSGVPVVQAVVFDDATRVGRMDDLPTADVQRACASQDSRRR